MGFMPYVRCNACNGTGKVIEASVGVDDLIRKWNPTGLLKGLSFCYQEKIVYFYEDLAKDISKYKNKDLQDEIFHVQRKAYPVKIKYEQYPNGDHKILTDRNTFVNISKELVDDIKAHCSKGYISPDLAQLIYDRIL